MVTRDAQTLWQIVKFSFMVFLFFLFFLFLFLSNQNVQEGFLELAVNRSLGKAKLVLVFNCSVFLCFNRSLKTCFKKTETKKHAKGDSTQGLKTLGAEGRRTPRLHRARRGPALGWLRIGLVAFACPNGSHLRGEQCLTDLRPLRRQHRARRRHH